VFRNPDENIKVKHQVMSNPETITVAYTGHKASKPPLYLQKNSTCDYLKNEPCIVIYIPGE
jgi:hypothetical protein